MALNKQKQNKQGINTEYWKITKQIVDFHNQEAVVEMWGWENQNKRNNYPKHPADKISFSWSLSLDGSFPFSNANNADEITTQSYSLIRLHPDWNDAVSV